MAKKTKKEIQDLDLTGIVDPKEVTKQESETLVPEQALISNEEAVQLGNIAEERKKYGDREIQTFAEAAASSASFGLSDQAIVQGAKLFGGEAAKRQMQEALRKRRQYNPEAEIAGEVTGIIGPTLLSGGTSLAAKGASAGIRGAAKAGVATEKLTAKVLSKAVADTGQKKLARDVIRKSIEKGAGSAVEGAFYGTGELVSENALGDADFNAENLIASAGTGALLGGAAGTAFGSIAATVPVIKNNKIVDFAKKKVNNLIDKKVASTKLTGMSNSRYGKLSQTKWGEEVLENHSKFLKDNIGLKHLDSTEQILKKSEAEFTRLGDEIGSIAQEIDDIAAASNVNILPSKPQVATRVQNQLDELAEGLRRNPDESAKKALRLIEKRRASWDDWLVDSTPVKAKDLRQLKTDLQKTAKWLRPIDDLPINGKMDRSVAEAVRQEFIDLADRVSTVDSNIGGRLRQANLDYATALEMTSNLRKEVSREARSEIVKFKDVLLADLVFDAGGGALATAAVAAKKFAESDLRRKLVILTDIEKANRLAENKITRGIKNFFDGKISKKVPALSTKIMLDSQLSLTNENGKLPKKAKTKKEAFKAISKNLKEYTQDPVKLADFLSKNDMLTSNAAPNTANAVNQRLITAVNFLASKLPTNVNTAANNLLFKRDWEPSSIEISKFERYMAAIDSPMSVLDELEAGELTRESVEALKAVYPNMYQRIQEAALDKIAENPELSYKKRLQIGVLLDIPADASLEPENIRGLQQTFLDEKQAQTAAIKPTQAGAAKIDFANDAESGTEKVAKRD